MCMDKPSRLRACLLYDFKGYMDVLFYNSSHLGLQLLSFSSTTPLTWRRLTIKELKAAVCKLLGLDLEQVQLWDYFQGRRYGDGPLDDTPDTNMEDAKLINGQAILALEKVKLLTLWLGILSAERHLRYHF